MLINVQAYTAAPPKRNHLIASLIKAISHRLLHPGASTIDILQVYISLIRVFAVLDAKGVLIDRVARPIRAYLRERDDTVKVIVNGLLADVKEGDEEDEQSRDDGDVLVDLAAELHQASARAGQSDDDHDFDWDDMQWAPDPVDAGPGRKSLGLTTILYHADAGGCARIQKIQERGRHRQRDEPLRLEGCTHQGVSAYDRGEATQEQRRV